MEYDPKVFAEIVSKDVEKNEKLKTKINRIQMMAMGIVKQILFPIIAYFEMTDEVKSFDLVLISINIGVPFFQNCNAISINVPGLSQVLKRILEAWA